MLADALALNEPGLADSEALWTEAVGVIVCVKEGDEVGVAL